MIFQKYVQKMMYGFILVGLWIRFVLPWFYVPELVLALKQTHWIDGTETSRTVGEGSWKKSLECAVLCVFDHSNDGIGCYGSPFTYDIENNNKKKTKQNRKKELKMILF